KCIYNRMNKPAVPIGYLERFAADNAESSPIAQPESNGIKIAVAGSGPAGLSFAGSMAAKGYDVTVFEALHEIGGVLKYGIPEFRLPNSVVEREIESLRALGVTFETNTIVGKTLSYDDLHNLGFKGLFVASGAGLPRFMNIPGENLINVLSANEYLTRINLMHAGTPGYATPVYRGKTVAIIGGGNTAMDSCRTAKRMGAERVIVVYRRSEAEMPARAEEVKHAREEGVEFMTLHNPIEYLGDENGRVRAMRLQRMELGEPDADGRRSPVAVDGAIEEIATDQVIVSVGVSPNPLIPEAINSLEVTRRGTIAADADTLKTSLPDVYAGGDIVRGGATVILAMGDGRKAAESMHQQLQNS
ncbi:MAG: FAD-dependent oxidoreductase, partial [Muribaculaceae bacterium]|nr:FAD-dependent oxidoreductase [Muribaculaceae bacterium]